MLQPQTLATQQQSCNFFFSSKANSNATYLICMCIRTLHHCTKCVAILIACVKPSIESRASASPNSTVKRTGILGSPEPPEAFIMGSAAWKGSSHRLRYIERY